MLKPCQVFILFLIVHIQFYYVLLFYFYLTEGKISSNNGIAIHASIV